MKNNFKRSNVNESTLQISQINRSGFDLSHRNDLDIRLGKLYPVNLEQLIAGDTIKGSLKPKLQFEKIVTPTIGRTRLDTHTFTVHLRRINRDFKQFIEDTTGQSQLPSFNIVNAAISFLDQVFIPKGANLSGDLFSTMTLSSYASDAVSHSTSFDVYISTLNRMYVSKFFYSSNGYTHDFWSEYLRYLSVFPEASSYGTSPLFWCKFAYYALKPLFGPGSLLDFLGYPIWSIYDRFYSTWKDISDSNQLGALGAKKIIDVLYNDKFLPITGSTIDFAAGSYNVVYSEMPLRAVYAIYYDYFRDWHIEKKSEVLDPDLFGSTSLITTAISDLNADITGANIFIQLLRLNTRYFARDFLNTVQTEDIFRHVYAPVFGNIEDLQDVGATGTGDYGSQLSNMFTNSTDLLKSIFIGNDNIPFPGGIFTPTDDSFYAYHADLQTMRRANMLEKWLARNYFFPDNYVGQILAHYGVKPEDSHILLSNFIGGSESMVSGDQHVASTAGTASSGGSSIATPAGTRTMVAGVDAQDSFTYSANDHCYVISMISLVPLVNYDVKSQFINIIRPMDIPTHEYAQDSRCLIRTKDLLRGFDNDNDLLGYVPRFYGFRVHGDETHGSYLTDKRSYNWFRDWYNMLTTNVTPTGYDNHAFVLSPYSMRINLKPDAFLGLADWDTIAFGSCDIEFFANRPLPAAIDFI